MTNKFKIEKVSADIKYSSPRGDGFFIPNCQVSSREDGDIMEIRINEPNGTSEIIITFKKTKK